MLPLSSALNTTSIGDHYPVYLCVPRGIKGTVQQTEEIKRKSTTSLSTSRLAAVVSLTAVTCDPIALSPCLAPVPSASCQLIQP